MTASLKSFIKTYAAIGAAICVLAILQTQAQTDAFLKIRTRYKWVVLMALFAVNALVGVVIALRRGGDETLWDRLQIQQRGRLLPLALGILLLFAPFPAIWYARSAFFGQGLEAFFRLLWLFWWLLLLQAGGLKLFTGLPWSQSWAAALVFDGFAAEVYVLFLPVSAYPFSMGWSEASRFYYGSLLFSKSLYGATLPLSIWHGTRYMLLSLPFLIPDVSLWAARLWQVLLWLGITLASSWLLIRRLRMSQRTVGLVLVGWFFLYLFQGAVYYHLQICVIIILLGLRRSRPVGSLLAVVAASFWAGMSRLNWYPVPAVLAIGLYLLEEPYSGKRTFWRYLSTPTLWGLVGMATALAGQAFYVAISGQTNLAAFGSSLTSQLLWYRWFPSATNPIGIIPGILIVSLPLWILIAWVDRNLAVRLHPIRWAALLGMMATLFVGGLIVSTKIGGGGDLHNMDAYMVLLGITGAYFLAGRVESETPPGPESAAIAWPIVACMLLVPVAFTLLRLGVPFSYDASKARSDLDAIRQAVVGYSASGPVLFIYERQLLTFHYITNVPVEPDYEVVSLMEMAISGNRPYLNQFYNDLASHRFAAIVIHPQNLGVQTGDFIEESNVWNRLVAQPLLCKYKAGQTFYYSKIQILIPRARSCPDFPPSLSNP